MALKHLVSIDDIINDTKRDKYPTDDILDEKFGDMINYLILAKAVIIEERQIQELKNE